MPGHLAGRGPVPEFSPVNVPVPDFLLVPISAPRTALKADGPATTGTSQTPGTGTSTGKMPPSRI